MGVMAKVQFNCRLDEGVRDRIVAIANESGMSQAEVIECLVTQRDIKAAEATLAELPAKSVILQPRKVSKKVKLAEERKAADPLAQALGRDDIDYMTPDELPSAGSVGVHLDAVSENRGKASIETWRASRKPLLKPGGRK